MTVSSSLYHTLQRELAAVAPGVHRPAQRRLALLVVALVATRSCVVAGLARRIRTLGLSSATAASLQRRLRRTMNDAQLVAETCYRPLIRRQLARAGDTPLMIAIDESSHQEWVHLLQATLLYRGGGIPLAWVTWPQNQAQEDGAYGAAMDQLLADLATCLPPRAQVIILADRLYAVPSFTDRLTASRWHWVIRITTTGKHRWCARLGPPDATRWGPDQALKELIALALPQPGTRVRTSGRYAKKAGWRRANLVGVWGVGHAAPLVVITDLSPRWLVLAWYRRRFWTEARFRDDKSAGWNWERSQVREVEHHGVLLLAMAWATLLSLWQGALAARCRLRATSGRQARPSHARESLATLGREALLPWVYGRAQPPARKRIPWLFPDLSGTAWSMEWSATLARHYIFGKTVRP